MQFHAGHNPSVLAQIFQGPQSLSLPSRAISPPAPETDTSTPQISRTHCSKPSQDHVCTPDSLLRKLQRTLTSQKLKMGQVLAHTGPSVTIIALRRYGLLRNQLGHLRPDTCCLLVHTSPVHGCAFDRIRATGQMGSCCVEVTVFIGDYL